MGDGDSNRDGGDCVRRAPAPALILEKRRSWSPEAEAGLSKTFGHDRAAIIAGVERGDLELFRVNDGRGWIVTRVDVELGELVVVCYQGRDARKITKLLFNLARKNRLQAVRFFTRSRGLPRLLDGFGFEQQETVWRALVPADPLPVERAS